jgi:hypothetical protein
MRKRDQKITFDVKKTVQSFTSVSFREIDDKDARADAGKVKRIYEISFGGTLSRFGADIL